MESGVWVVVHGTWCFDSSRAYMESGVWVIVHGKWSLGSSRWKVVLG